METVLIRMYVRKAGLEPAYPFGRQPLKLVRLPISPLPQMKSCSAVINLRLKRCKVNTMFVGRTAGDRQVFDRELD